MKKFLILSMLWSILPIRLWGSTSDEFQKALDETGVAMGERSTAQYNTAINPNDLEETKRLPPDKKAKLAAKLTQLLPRLVQEHKQQPYSDSSSAWLGISMLEEIGSDEQKIEVFGKLDLYGESLLRPACEALSTCEGPEGVRILKKFAENALQSFDKEYTEFKKTAVAIAQVEGEIPSLLRLGQSLKALEGAYHSDGPVTATTLRAGFINLGSRYQDAALVASLEEEFAKDIKIGQQRRERLIRERHPILERKNNPVSHGLTDAVSRPSSIAISWKKWLWPGIGIVLLVLLAIRVHIRHK